MSPRTRTGVLRLLLPTLAGSCFLGIASGQGVLFSIDYHGPTIGAPDSVFGVPITEGDILLALPAMGPLPPPGIVYSAGVGPTLNHLGLAWYPATVGHPPGVMGFVEVDAFSLGRDPMINADQAFSPGAIAFSVDEFAASTPGNPLLPDVFSECPSGDSSADVFTNLVFIPVPNPVPPLFAAPHVGLFDGDGLPSGTGFRYPGLGLVEPNAPQGAPPDPGDNLDALELEHEDWSALFFSLDSLYVDPHPLMGGLTNSGSAFAHGFVGSDVLMTLPGAPAPVLYASAIALGLDASDPDHNDIDALVLLENGNLVFEAPQFPDHWVSGATDMIFFSVRRGSAVIGSMDSLRGMPIEEGDILMPPISPAFGGLSPFPGIYVPAEMIGLATVRAGNVSAAAPALGFADDLDALDFFDVPHRGLHAAEYCHCPGGLPCGNPDPLAGCANSTGAGAYLSASGSSSVSSDDLVLSASQLPTGQFGLIFMGGGQPSAVFGDGLRCVGAGGVGLFRYAVQNSGAVGSMTEGPGIVATSIIRFGAPGTIAPGSTWNFQGWFRDPAGPCGSGFNTSNAVVVRFVP